jgi:hypothetical protein
MKRNFRIILIAAFLVTSPLLMLAQNPPHPNGGNAPSAGNGNGPVGGGAPIGGGMVVMLALGAAYGARKVYQMRSTASVQE